MTPEGKIKKEICDFLRANGAYVFCPVQRGMGAATLDILACWRGWFLAIEVKVPGKKPTKRQQFVAKEISKAYGVALVAYSVEDVAKWVSAG